MQTPEGKELPVEHCIEGTHGWEIAEGIDIPDCLHIDKPTFGWTKWNQYDFETIELVGLISVDASCCAGVTPESHEAALTTMKMCQIQIK